MFVTTITILASANMFGQSYLLTKGAPGTPTRTAIMYIADEGLSQNQMGAASAMSYVLFAVLAVISIINFRLQRRNQGQRSSCNDVHAGHAGRPRSAGDARRRSGRPRRGPRPTRPRRPLRGPHRSGAWSSCAAGVDLPDVVQDRLRRDQQPRVAVPNPFSFDAYQTLSTATQPILRWFLNSLAAGVLQTPLILVTASMGAYALARLDFPGKKIVFGAIVLTLFVPPVIFLIPNYLIVQNLGWLDTLWAITIPEPPGRSGSSSCGSSSSACPGRSRRRRGSTGPGTSASSCRSSCRCPGRRSRRSRC